jgi:hypothetical protein
MSSWVCGVAKEGEWSKSNGRIILRRPVDNGERPARGGIDVRALRKQTHPPSQTSEIKVGHLGRHRMTRRRWADKKE